MQKRVNKTKKEIVADIKKVQEADRIRDLIKTKIFPFLKEMAEDVRYTKIFVATNVAAVEQAMMLKQNDLKVGELSLMGMFDAKDERVKKYSEMFELFKDETVNTFMRALQDFPRLIDEQATNNNDKLNFNSIDLEKLLG